MHSNNNSDLATTVLSRKRVAMASVDSTNESLPVRSILPRYVFLNRLNADVQRQRHGHTPNSNALLLALYANELHPLTTTTSRFAFASEEELSKLAKRVTPTNTAKTTAWALNNFQHWMAIIVVILLQIVHVYRRASNLSPTFSVL